MTIPNPNQPNPSKSPYNQSINQLLLDFQSQKEGLSSEQAESITKTVGLNKIVKRRKSFYKKYISPVVNLMMVILLLAAVVQIYLVHKYNEGSYFSPITILIILSLNIIIGMSQQVRAEKTLEALKRLSSFKSFVLRDNKTIEISADELVPGDILLLKQGDYISADARLFEGNELYVDESVLTGETQAVNKTTDVLSTSNLQLQEQTNMVFSSTFVTSGHGKALVTATGINTEIGKITKGIAQAEKRDIPLQKQMNAVGRNLGLLVLIIIVGLFLYKYLLGSTNIIGEISWLISLAVAAIPFNFPLITTIILLTGVIRLARQQAIVRNLNAIETMGRLNVICSDKTGTLTRNEMTVQRIYQDSKEYKVTGLGFQSEGKIFYQDQEINIFDNLYLWKLISTGVVNNQSELTSEQVALRKGFAEVIRVIGSSTEGALLTLAQKANINPENERGTFKILKEFTFTSERKRMTRIVEREGKVQAFVKGAPEILLEKSTHTIVDGGISSLTSEITEDYHQKIDRFASSGLRTLAFAYVNLENISDPSILSADEVEQNLVFLGMVGIKDPPRKGVKDSISKCHEAGIKVVMITGDHPKTAQAVADQIGIYKPGDRIATGAEISSLSEVEMSQISVFARVAPEDKNVIVKAYQSQKQIIAMTGDGVNDALALENADVGVAMGMTGTDVAKNAADLILTDDSFNTIERAVFHGRGLFNNIRSNTMFLLICALSELTVLTTIALLFNEEVFSGFQLILLYTSVHFFPPWGLMFDKYDQKLMEEPPKKVGEPLVNKKFMGLMILQIVVISSILIILFMIIRDGTYPLYRENYLDLVYTNPISNVQLTGYVYNGDYITFSSSGADLALLRYFKGQTICFITLVLSEIWVVYEARSIKRSVFQGIFNTTLTILIAIVLVILALITQYDLAQAYFIMVPLSPIDWGVAFGGSLLVVIISKIYKKIVG